MGIKESHLHQSQTHLKVPVTPEGASICAGSRANYKKKQKARVRNDDRQVCIAHAGHTSRN